MEFRIADTFTASLARLSGQEQKAVKTTAFDLQMNPANPGLQFHKLDKSRDPNFWSLRVNRDIRLIVHKTSADILLCYVDHHDDAYKWAERRKLETHPQTGAAQLVEVRETVHEIAIPKYVEVEEAAPAKQLLFSGVKDEDLLQYGVPAEWLGDVRAADEDSLFELAEHLPDEAAEALLELAVGKRPQPTQLAKETTDPFAHPDAQRRFRTLENVEELTLALEYPWEQWTVFLHPEQRRLVEKTYDGPVRISGSAGTGKTIVGLHRAVHLARSNQQARVLLTTFSPALANALQAKLRILISKEPRLGERIEVYSMEALGRHLYESNIGKANLPQTGSIEKALEESAAQVEGHTFSARFLWAEWAHVVDAWQLKSWDQYRDVVRLGRKKRLPEKQRTTLWSIFEKTLSSLESKGLLTYPQLYGQLAAHFRAAQRSPYEHIIVDEAQDVSVPQLRLLAALGANRPDALFFTGDLGQRIFQDPFSWKSLGVDLQGRSRTLRVNYRTSHQIRAHADRLLDPQIADVDGTAEERNATVSVFNGPVPRLVVSATEDAESQMVGGWIKERIEDGIAPRAIAVFVRSDAQLDRARDAILESGSPYKTLSATVGSTPGHIALCTMHFAKGLEFRAVAVMGCDDEVIPLQERIESVADDADLEEVYNTERHLLYVACTRARDQLLISGVSPESEFLGDMGAVERSKP